MESAESFLDLPLVVWAGLSTLTNKKTRQYLLVMVRMTCVAEVNIKDAKIFNSASQTFCFGHNGCFLRGVWFSVSGHRGVWGFFQTSVKVRLFSAQILVRSAAGYRNSMSVTVKAYLLGKDEAVKEIRRFAVDQDVSCSFEYLSRKTMGVFSSLNNSSFNMYYRGQLLKLKFSFSRFY